MHRCRPMLLVLWITLSCALLADVAIAADGDHHAVTPSDPHPAPSHSMVAAEDSVAAEGSPSPDASPLDLAAPAWGGPLSPLAASIDVQVKSSCTPCSSPQGSCTSVAQCNNYCQALVGENGFCMTTGCNCCVCPDALPDPGDGEDFPDICQPVCRCDGVPGPQGGCASGCRQVNCL